MMKKNIGICILVSIIANIHANNGGRNPVSFYDHDANFLGSVACSGEKTLVDTWSQTPAFPHWQAVSKLLFFDRNNGKVISNPATALCLKHVNVSITDLSTTGQPVCGNSLTLSGQDLLRASNYGSGIKCNICQFIAKKLIDYSATAATQNACKAFADKLCDHLPFFGAQCHDWVDLICQQIHQKLQTASCPICTTIRLCTQGECFPNLSALKNTTKAICVGETADIVYRMNVREVKNGVSCNTHGWTKRLNFYTTHLLVPEAEVFWVLYDTNPWRWAISEGEHVTGAQNLENGGLDCWIGCNEQEGKCDWCGRDGWCCSKQRTGECDGIFNFGTSTYDAHQCVLKPDPVWKFTFQFWAFKTKMPGTVAYSVGEAGGPQRFLVFQGTNANKNGWTHRFTFWAYPSQQALDHALNL